MNCLASVANEMIPGNIRFGNTDKDCKIFYFCKKVYGLNSFISLLSESDCSLNKTIDIRSMNLEIKPTLFRPYIRSLDQSCH